MPDSSTPTSPTPNLEAAGAPDAAPGPDASTTVVIPAYRSESTIGELLARVRNSCPQATVIVVDDASDDGTWNALVNAHTHTDPALLALRLRTNVGQSRAVLVGIGAARSPVIVTLDDDLEHRPEDIPLLVSALAECAVVYGRPRTVSPHPLWRRAVSVAARSLGRLLGVPPSVAAATSFRAFHADLVDPSCDIPIDLQLGRSGRRTRVVKVEAGPRRPEGSRYGVGRLLGVLWIHRPHRRPRPLVVSISDTLPLQPGPPGA